MPRVFVAASDGLHRFDEGGVPGPVEFADRAVTALAPAADDLWAVVEHQELWHASGGDWRAVAALGGIHASCLASVDGQVLVGGAEARLFRLTGTELEPLSSFEKAAGRSTWYTPWGGPPATRSIANWDEDVYVNVHVGGIQHARWPKDEWEPTIDIDADVHQVTTAEGLVLAASAGGLATSADLGTTWSFRSDGLEAPYARAVAVCGKVVLLSASGGPRGGRAAVYRGALGGGTFEHCPAGPGWFEDNIDTFCLDALPDGSFAAFGSSDGQVYASTDAGSTWDELASGLPPVRRILVMP